MRDLEIRGAGNLLGERQHGHMEAVGYDLYCKMLNEAVKTLKGTKKLAEDFNTHVDMDGCIHSTIPHIVNEAQGSWISIRESPVWRMKQNVRI